jgi:outer membrane protein assembly factor BamB
VPAVRAEARRRERSVYRMLPIMRNRTILAALALALCQGPIPQARRQPAAASGAAWPQWGGPTRNFMVDAKGLASKWPAAGPKKLWSRPLGEGHSSIAVDANRLYTMYRPVGLLGMVRRSQEEVIAALDANTGTTIWEHKFESPTAGLDFSQGAGPHATPLVTGDRVFATGSRKELFALNKANGQVVWSHDLIKEYGASGPGRGYACSPLLYNDMLIVSVGGPGQALAAFNPKTGALIWKAGDFEFSPASPIIIDVDGQKQLLYFAGNVVAGLNPATGQTLWTHPHKTDWGLNISTPVWSPSDHLLFVSSAYSTGSRVLELRQTAGKTTATEKWFNGRMRVHIGTAIRIGSHIYGSSGDFGPAFLTAVDVTTGKVEWQDRAFARAQLLYADGKLVILDEDGTLGLATVTPQGLQVLAKAPILENLAWTPPTVVGTRLYARDRKNIVSFELGAQ